MLLLKVLLTLMEMHISLSLPEYYLGTDRVNYEGAQVRCRRHFKNRQGSLAMPKTNEEAEAVEKLLTASKKDLKPPRMGSPQGGSLAQEPGSRLVYLGATGQKDNAKWNDGSSIGTPPPFIWGSWIPHVLDKSKLETVNKLEIICVGIGKQTGTEFKLFNVACKKWVLTLPNNHLSELTYDFTAQYLCQAPEVIKTTTVPPSRTTTERSNNTTTILIVMLVCVVVLMFIGVLGYKKWTNDNKRRRAGGGDGDGDTDASGLSGMSLGTSSTVQSSRGSSRMSSSIRGRSSRGSSRLSVSFRGSSRASSRTSFGSRASSSSLGSRGSRGSRSSNSSRGGSKRSFRARGSTVRLSASSAVM